MQNGGWIRTEDRLPVADTWCLIATLNRYINNRWQWTVESSLFKLREGQPYWWAERNNSYRSPDYWMPFPDPPEMTEEQETESEMCFQRDKIDRVLNARKKLEEVEKL